MPLKYDGLRDFINKNYGGNVRIFCKIFGIHHSTAYDIMNGKRNYKKDTPLRAKLRRKGLII